MQLSELTTNINTAIANSETKKIPKTQMNTEEKKRRTQNKCHNQTKTHMLQTTVRLKPQEYIFEKI